MDITSQIIENPSGGTVSLTADPLPTYGYFVGGVVSALIVDESNATPVTEIDFFIRYVRESTGALYLGWWTDEETGKLYVDATTWVADVDKALRLGEERGEIAIFDIECKTSLYLES